MSNSNIEYVLKRKV